MSNTDSAQGAVDNVGGRSLSAFTAFNSVLGIVIGLIGPFFTVYIASISGGAEKLGIAFSIMIFIQSLTSFAIGRFSDRIGRKPFLFLTAYTDAGVIFCYTLITQTYQVYILQALLGATNAVNLTIKEALLADLTRRERRGTEIGRFNSIVSLFSAAGIAIGGYVAKYYGLKSVFYLVSFAIVCSTALLFFVDEGERG